MFSRGYLCVYLHLLATNCCMYSDSTVFAQLHNECHTNAQLLREEEVVALVSSPVDVMFSTHSSLKNIRESNDSDDVTMMLKKGFIKNSERLYHNDQRCTISIWSRLPFQEKYDE